MARAGKKRRHRMLSEAEVIGDSQRFFKALRNHALDCGVKLPAIDLRVGCSLAEAMHSGEPRVVAHVGCEPHTVCVAAAFGALNRNKRYGVLAHEVGHLMAGLDGSGAEGRADQWMRDQLGIEILYDSGDTSEFLDEKTVMGLGL